MEKNLKLGLSDYIASQYEKQKIKNAKKCLSRPGVELETKCFRSPTLYAPRHSTEPILGEKTLKSTFIN